MREVLLAYMDRCRQRAFEHYRFRVLTWTIVSLFAKKPPEQPRPPEILNDEQS